jgi:hypothetical protein
VVRIKKKIPIDGSISEKGILLKAVEEETVKKVT